MATATCHHALPRPELRLLQKPTPTSKPVAESLSGLIERVTFFNEETGFAVLKVKAKGHRDQVTVIGSLPLVSAGEWLTAEGQWIQDREFGLQFRAEMLNSTAPTTREGIEKYLGSGMVKGIGPVYAKKLVEKYGEQIFDIIENQSAKLEDVEGIGPKRRKKIKDAWAEQKVIRQIMVFLHSNGVSTSRAVRIFKTYGETAIEKVQANPYALAKDIHGIGFKTADQIAQKIGIPIDSLIRACAGLSHVLLEATGEGHCALPMDLLKDLAGKLLLVEDKVVTEALERTLGSRDLVKETINGQELIFLPALRRAEEIIAARIKGLCQSPPAFPAIDFEKALAWCQNKTGKALASSQQEALKLALTSRATARPCPPHRSRKLKLPGIGSHQDAVLSPTLPGSGLLPATISFAAAHAGLSVGQSLFPVQRSQSHKPHRPVQTSQVLFLLRLVESSGIHESLRALLSTRHLALSDLELPG